MSNNRIEEANAKLPDREKEKASREVHYIKSQLIKNSRKRARAKGLAHTLGVRDITLPERCPILGYVLKRNKGKLGKDSYSLDRIDNAEGYVQGNVRVISFWANTLKDNLTLEQIERLYKYVKNEGEL